MKFFVLALALCGWGLSAHGQFVSNIGTSEPIQAYSSPIVVNDIKRVAYKVAYPPGYRMRNTGRLLTLIGVPLFIGGIIVFENAEDNYYSSLTSTGATYYEEEEAAAGALMTVAGAGLAIPGIIFWTKGAKKYKRHLEREAAFYFNGKGLSLSYRF
jgi:hypothetical protein